MTGSRKRPRKRKGARRRTDRKKQERSARQTRARRIKEVLRFCEPCFAMAIEAGQAVVQEMIEERGLSWEMLSGDSPDRSSDVEHLQDEFEETLETPGAVEALDALMEVAIRPLAEHRQEERGQQLARDLMADLVYEFACVSAKPIRQAISRIRPPKPAKLRTASKALSGLADEYKRLNPAIEEKLRQRATDFDSDARRAEALLELAQHAGESRRGAPSGASTEWAGRAAARFTDVGFNRSTVLPYVAPVARSFLEPGLPEDPADAARVLENRIRRETRRFREPGKGAS